MGHHIPRSTTSLDRAEAIRPEGEIYTRVKGQNIPSSAGGGKGEKRGDGAGYNRKTKPSPWNIDDCFSLRIVQKKNKVVLFIYHSTTICRRWGEGEGGLYYTIGGAQRFKATNEPLKLKLRFYSASTTTVARKREAQRRLFACAARITLGFSRQDMSIGSFVYDRSKEVQMRVSEANQTDFKTEKVFCAGIQKVKDHRTL